MPFSDPHPPSESSCRVWAGLFLLLFIPPLATALALHGSYWGGGGGFWFSQTWIPAQCLVSAGPNLRNSAKAPARPGPLIHRPSSNSPEHWGSSRATGSILLVSAVPDYSSSQIFEKQTYSQNASYELEYRDTHVRINRRTHAIRPVHHSSFS